MSARTASVGFERKLLGLALAALVLSLSGCDKLIGLQEISRPNYYPCDCSCSRRVTAPLGAAVLSLPGQGSVVDIVPLGSMGTILDGPTDADLNGSPTTWWQVQFDVGAKGWVPESNLTVANETLVTKQPRVCLPPEFNWDLGGTTDPTIGDLQALCRDDVAFASQAVVNEKLAPLGKYLCECDAQAVSIKTFDDDSCSVPCPDGDDVCLVAGSDPPDPTPDPLEAALFQPTSICEVEGQLGLLVDGRAPKRQPTARGTLQIHGRSCTPGESCLVGMSYQLTSDDIEFDSGTIFASDPKFVDLAVSGATEPDIVDLGPFLGFYLGAVPAQTAYTTAHGRRPSWLIGRAISGRNTQSVALAMNWANATCRLSGELVGAAEGDGAEGTLAAEVDVALDGVIVNQPPLPDAGSDQTVECTSPAGADVTVDASGTTDPDGNLSFYVWRRGAEDGAQLAAPSPDPVAKTQQALGQETYFLQAVDRLFSADVDDVQVSVADTTAPSIACNAPATIVPSDVPEKRTAGISFTATAADGCTGVSAVAIESFTCARPASCSVGFDGPTITIYDSGGVGDVIRWTVTAQDAAGNEAQQTCEVNVVKKPKL